jgi:hypothetical protein
MGTDVVFIQTFDTMTKCEEFKREAPKELQEQLACLAIAKPGVYRDNDSI